MFIFSFLDKKKKRKRRKTEKNGTKDRGAEVPIGEGKGGWKVEKRVLEVKKFKIIIMLRIVIKTFKFSVSNNNSFSKNLI